MGVVSNLEPVVALVRPLLLALLRGVFFSWGCNWTQALFHVSAGLASMEGINLQLYFTLHLNVCHIVPIPCFGSKPPCMYWICSCRYLLLWTVLHFELHLILTYVVSHMHKGAQSTPFSFVDRKTLKEERQASAGIRPNRLPIV